MAFRQTVDLARYPDLVVIMLGMRANSFRGLGALLKMGPRIQKAVDAKPDGLLSHEQFVFSLLPPHFGMRQYWRDLEALENWTRNSPHLDWWQEFHKDPQGTKFWHEAYFMKGGIDAVYLSDGPPVGLQRFAPAALAHGAMSSARMRAAHEGAAPPASTELYPER